MSVSNLPAIHPGEILRDLYLLPMEMSPYGLAKKLHVPRTRIERIVAEKTAITPDTALRLARFFKTTPEFWMNLQNSFDLTIEAQALKGELEKIAQYEHAA
ncbi:MAG: HigA family addiction module antidote protein [Alphaproteobacteria bacterium]|jgi:antitoxin HigA-1|nr:HigA family addiction module antidote protein [Alphaproteobacteria bacterium]MBU1548650.1 HigA family addiction module antidote protein [Alphaproteobacteria bacterium]MBU2335476.1 HigA family addiction module antidote protein [Alphaproteobacteria bacterium]MBU2391129.1 HigA family addiction module antidote protein [Alphaproteobacteria bacterium]